MAPTLVCSVVRLPAGDAEGEAARRTHGRLAGLLPDDGGTAVAPGTVDHV